MRDDSEIQQSVQKILERLRCLQQNIDGVRPPKKDLAASYDKIVQDIGDLRGGTLFYPYLSTGLGNGPWVELADGSVKYDFITGIGVHYMGHGHPVVVRAALEAALEDTLMQGNLQQSVWVKDVLADLLAAANRRGASLAHAFLTTSGAMANENAYKIVFQKHAPADRLLAFERGFAGRTLVNAWVSDKPSGREGLPQVIDVDYVPFYDGRDHEGSIQRAVSVLKKHLHAHPRRYAAMVMELIQGEGGYYPGHKEFFQALIDVVKEAGIAVMVDEIQTIGRTPELFAFQWFELDDLVDVVTVGKMTQFCATLFREEYKPRPGLVSQTFTASTAALWAGRAILNEILNHGYLGGQGRIARLGRQFENGLMALAEEFPEIVSGPFGFGVMTAMTVFNGETEKTKQFLRCLFDRGVIAFIAGRSPSRVRFLMPVGATEEIHVDEVCGLIRETLKAMTG